MQAHLAGVCSAARIAQRGHDVQIQASFLQPFAGLILSVACVQPDLALFRDVLAQARTLLGHASVKAPTALMNACCI